MCHRLLSGLTSGGHLRDPLASLMMLIAIFAPLITPYDFSGGRRASRLQPPLFGGVFVHLLGTDQLGRDVLSRRSRRSASRSPSPSAPQCFRR